MCVLYVMCVCIEARVHVILIEYTCNMKMHVSFWYKLFAFLQDFDSNHIDDGGSDPSGPDPNAWPGRGTVCCLLFVHCFLDFLSVSVSVSLLSLVCSCFSQHLKNILQTWRVRLLLLLVNLLLVWDLKMSFNMWGKYIYVNSLMYVTWFTCNS